MNPVSLPNVPCQHNSSWFFNFRQQSYMRKRDKRPAVWLQHPAVAPGLKFMLHIDYDGLH
jgi:hypothetical protein